MHVELGNPKPHDASPEHMLPGPAVTSIEIPDDYTLEPGADVKDLALHLAQNPDVTNLPDHEAFLAVVHPAAGAWTSGKHGVGTPSWVHVEGPDPAKAAELQRLLGEFWGVPQGRPADVEDTHYTKNGPPGVGPEA